MNCDSTPLFNNHYDKDEEEENTNLQLKMIKWTVPFNLHLSLRRSVPLTGPFPAEEIMLEVNYSRPSDQQGEELHLNPSLSNSRTWFWTTCPLIAGEWRPPSPARASPP